MGTDDAESGVKGRRVRKALMWGAAAGGAAGAAGAALTAAKARTVRAGLSRPREPFQWMPPAGSSVLLKGVEVVDVRAGKVLHERGLLYEDGWITGVVATRDLDKVEAGKVFDCGGLFAIPGLVNCHCHSLMPGALGVGLDLGVSLKRQALRNLEECAVRGVTTVRDTSSLPLVFAQVAEKVEACELLGPRMIGCASGIKQKGGYPDFSYPLPAGLARKWGQFAHEVSNAESGREAVRTVVEQGARFVKIFFADESLFFSRKPLETYDGETLRAIVDEAHGLGRKVAVHHVTVGGFRRALDFGVDDLEHMPVDELLTDRDAAAFMKGDHCITPTITVGMCLGVARKGHPALAVPTNAALQETRRHVQSTIAPTAAEAAVNRANNRMVAMLESLGEGEKPRAPMMSYPEPFLTGIGEANILKMYEAGATLCCGNDGGIPLTWPGTISVEMQMLNEIGVSTADVLRSATLNAAKLLGMEGELGSLGEGKLADIVLLSANPLQDIRAVERVEAVFRSGVLLHQGPRFALGGR